MQTNSPSDVLVVQMGRPPKDMRARFGEQGDWFRRVLAPMTRDVAVVRPAEGGLLPAADEFGAAIVTGSWAMVTDRPAWSERTRHWLGNLMACNKPTLGVCYGHQLMADAVGGRVGDHPAGRELGQLDVTLTRAGQNDGWLADTPAVFPAYLTHRQSVLEAPANARILARSDQDAHQILRYDEAVLSVQFHPEFTVELLGACIESNRHTLGASETDRRLAELGAAPEPVRLLRRFVDAAACTAA